ncbi:MAG: porin [Alphaproteobacteria bacterium]|nr:porin [Alphaproteobacteria bacterium]
MNKYSLSAMLAAGLLAGSFATGANAADLGGDCCADLEERVAELEATTARKGNRKVSLTVSGFVAQQVLIWDDGHESNVYVTDTGSVSIGTHFAFSGKAQINSEWEAGFLIKIEAINNDSLLVSQNADDGILNPGGNAQALLTGSSGALGLESAYWYLKSKRLGRVSVGQQSSAADNQAILPDGSGSLVQANYVLYDTNAFFTRSNNTYNGFVWGHIANCQTLDGYGGANGDCDGVPSNVVRYDTPTIAGFGASASWGEDDVWAISGRYAGEFSGVKIAGAIAYHHSTDENGTGLSVTGAQASANGGLDVGHLQLGGYIEHVASGVFFYGAYAHGFNDVTAAARGNGLNTPESDMFYLKAGLKRKVFALGSTTFYGEYGQKEDAMFTAIYNAGVDSSEMRHYGVGVVQNVDAAAMQLWLSWRHNEGDVTCNNAVAGGCAGLGLVNGNNNLEGFDVVKMGGLINF